MRKVNRRSLIRCHKGTLLLYMCAKHGLECLLEQMRRAVVLADILAVSLIYRQVSLCRRLSIIPSAIYPT